jgi:hypothetical protein
LDTYDQMRDPVYAAKQMKLQWIFLLTSLIWFCWCGVSAEGKGGFIRGITSYVYCSLASANTEDTPALIAKAAEEVKAIKESTANPGLAEQLDLQLERLINNALPDLEFILMPNFSAFSPSHLPRWHSKHSFAMVYRPSL